MIAHTLNMCAPYILCTFDNIFEIVELCLHHLWSAYIVYLCVISNSNRFHSFIFKLCIMIVHPLKMCTDDAGPEQSLVLLAHVLGAQKNRLIETVLSSSHNGSFRNRENLQYKINFPF